MVGFFWLFVLATAVVLGALVGLAFLNPIAGAVVALPALALPFVVPASRERRDRRRAVAGARAWLRARPDPLMLAFAIGGPDRVTDVILADLVRHERLSITDGVLHRSGGDSNATEFPEWARPLTAAVLTEAERPIAVQDVRETVHKHPVTTELWERVAADGMIRSPYARGRQQTWISSWLIASALGSLAVVINGLAALQEDIPDAVWMALSVLFVVTTVASPFVVLYLYNVDRGGSADTAPTRAPRLGCAWPNWPPPSSGRRPAAIRQHWPVTVVGSWR
ncbi:hypothetical protein [Paractinoplanes brasiliensis]|uniref:Uncharacterized protein (TIGR04222 family) n=1 Tax=Paractinoplanes brasiliensis TaxID=52695 RepID=A0A4R6K3A6_9ACTN|nr:hypothetical protein [Actinoplanes brasiliensis]TDO41685.1 uncharacterized protein (TIGR04222 family) [Actinoplanes brasiliensis]GID27028.1 hypothetical protein Abr02nite_20110 [Actinoplanes brasiliensis]